MSGFSRNDAATRIIGLSVVFVDGLAALPSYKHRQLHANEEAVTVIV